MLLNAHPPVPRSRKPLSEFHPHLVDANVEILIAPFCMSTWVWPPVAPDELRRLEEETLVRLSCEGRPSLADLSSSQTRELQWYLKTLQDSLGSLKGGLEECVALLAPQEPGSTLVLSSLRSESIKGHVTRVGSKIVKGVGSPFLASDRGNTVCMAFHPL